MKKLQLYIYSILLGMLSMSMGFPNFIIDKDLPKKTADKVSKKTKTEANAMYTAKAAYCTKIDKYQRAWQPLQKNPHQNQIVN